ncbi:MAG: hypothetical protein MI862_08575 [Desulfobacterales bacterium]|nr:hypothetical protein [Desulfobacterales bacterium]
MSNSPNPSRSQIQVLVPFLFGAGIMLSPDTLVMAGGFYGNTGMIGILAVAAAGLAYLLFLPQYVDTLSPVLKQGQGTGKPERPMQSFLMIFSLTVKIAAVLFLATGMLVSSGFIFNEVFVYWFPNFGFAFLLLFVLAGFQFLSQNTVIRLQLSFVGIVISGLLILIIAGFFSLPDPTRMTVSGTAFSPNNPVDMVFIPLLIFIGLDMGMNLFDRKKETTKLQLAVSVGLVLLLIAAWGIVALKFVPMERLSQTTISHIIVSRSILGNTGRIIMGVIVIAGTLAAVNALFTSIKMQLAGIIEAGGEASGLARVAPTAGIGVIGISIAVLMAGGLAGYTVLETLIRGALIFWLSFYALISLVHLKRVTAASVDNGLKYSLKIIKNIIPAMVFLSGIIMLVLTNDESIALITFSAILFGITLIGWLTIRLKQQTIKLKEEEL